MNLVQWNMVVDGAVDDSPWGSPWLASVERVIEVAERLNDRVQIWPAVPVELSLLEQVKAYARAHYDTGGWDVVVECWSDHQITEALTVLEPGGWHEAATIEEALNRTALMACVTVWADQQADAAVEGCTGDKFCRYHEHT